jgi:hypothetical protein
MAVDGGVPGHAKAIRHKKNGVKLKIEKAQGANDILVQIAGGEDHAWS